MLIINAYTIKQQPSLQFVPEHVVKPLSDSFVNKMDNDDTKMKDLYRFFMSGTILNMKTKIQIVQSFNIFVKQTLIYYG